MQHSTTQKSRQELPIAVALDADWQASKVWLTRLRGKVWGFKVGSILYCEQGNHIIREIQDAGFRVFLDLKFHDIPNTVAGAVKNAFALGVNLLTVHACGGANMLKAAAKEQSANQSVLAVTVLTSLDQKDLGQVGVSRNLEDQVSSLADLVIESGVKGLVCSPLEVQNLRKKFPGALLVTPGVRLAEPGSQQKQNVQDQKRVATLDQTLKSGASLAVLGRALTESTEWEKTWESLSSSLDGMSFQKL